MKTKLAYFFSSLKKRLVFEGNTCPSCGSKSATVLERKFLVTDLRRCGKCQLLFRTPTTTEKENFLFYQENYTQGFTTDCPSDAYLRELIDVKFVNTEKDYTRYLNILSALGAKPGQKLLDYGCSWGYGSWQFKEAGYTVTGFEISKPRCQYAREKLGIDARDVLADIQKDFDIIFSSHVIEHLPSVSNYLDFAIKHLRPGGMLVTICPNGSEIFRTIKPVAYNQIWGIYHPQLLDEKFYMTYFGKDNLLINSRINDLDFLKKWNKKYFVLGDLSGHELLSIWSKARE
jgi:2-polyprenyl-3-methyl-5-hydroxy-6-metoxy-1,4-benzoquinol methylase